MSEFDVEFPDMSGVPERYRSALETLFQIGMDHDRVFIARTWLDTYLDERKMVPRPACWILRARALDEANEVGFVIRNVLNSLAKEELADTIKREEADAVYDVLSRRAIMIDMHEAMHILRELGVPVYFNREFHERADVLNVPFRIDTGFTPQTVSTWTAHAPYKV